VKRDFDTRIEVDSEVKPGDQVILNPPVNLVDGGEVRFAQTPRQPASRL
jgi:hypothetical protein